MSWYDDLKEGMKEKKEEKAQLREVEQNAYKEAALERKHEKAAERVERAREKGLDRANNPFSKKVGKAAAGVGLFAMKSIKKLGDTPAPHRPEFTRPQPRYTARRAARPRRQKVVYVERQQQGDAFGFGGSGIDSESLLFGSGGKGRGSGGSMGESILFGSSSKNRKGSRPFDIL